MTMYHERGLNKILMNSLYVILTNNLSSQLINNWLIIEGFDTSPTLPLTRKGQTLKP